MARDQKNCHKCRNELKWDWEVCPFCGSVQHGYEKDLPTAEKPQEAADDAGVGHLDFEPAPGDTGFAPPERLPAITPDSAVAPQQDTDYAVILLPDNQFDISIFGRALSSIVKRPLADLTVPIRKGFVARDLDSRLLPEVAALLNAHAINAVALPEADVLPLPPVYRAASVIFDDDHFSCGATAPDERTYRLDFSADQVRFATAVRSMYAASVAVEQKQAGYRNALFRKRYLAAGRSRKSANRDVFGHEYVIYLFLKNPERLLVIRGASFDHETILRKAITPENMQKQAQLLTNNLTTEACMPGLQLLADLDEDAREWRSLTFASIKGADAFANWLYNLHFISF